MKKALLTLTAILFAYPALCDVTIDDVKPSTVPTNAGRMENIGENFDRLKVFTEANEDAIAAIPSVLDEDNMSTDSPTQPPSQQSVKAYVDTGLALKQDASTASTDAERTAHTDDTANPHSVTKSQVGLGNVDNTSDANKPVSTAQQTALDAKQDAARIDVGVTLTGSSWGGGYAVTEPITQATVVTSGTGWDMPEFSTAVGRTFGFHNDDAVGDDAAEVFINGSDDLGEDYATGVGPVLEVGWSAYIEVLDPTNARLSLVRPDYGPAPNASNATLSRAEHYGGKLEITAAIELDLLAGETGMEFSGIVFGAVAGVIDPNGSEVINLNGTDLTGGNSITSDGSGGEVVEMYWNGTKWIVQAYGWTDTGS